MKKGIIFFTIIGIVIILWVVFRDTSGFVVGYWKIENIDDGRDIPDERKAVFRDQINKTGYFLFSDNDSIEVRMGDKITRGSWVFDDSDSTLLLRKVGVDEDELMFVYMFGDDLMVLQEEVLGKSFEITLRKQPE